MDNASPYQIIGEGLPKLAVITPASSLASLAAEVAKSLHFPTCIIQTGLDEELRVARDVQRWEHIEVIAGRGQLVFLLRKETDLPILSVDFSSEDILDMILPFQGTGIQIGHLCFPGNAPEIIKLASQLGIGMHRLEVESLEQVETTLDRAKRMGITHILGGVGLVDKARNRGFKGILSRGIGRENLLKMFQNAAYIVALGTRSRKQLETLHGISNLIEEAVLTTDCTCRIQYANEKARQMLVGGQQALIGDFISKYLPSLDCSRLLLPNLSPDETSLTSNVAGKQVIVRHSPLSLHGQVEGAVLCIQYVSDIQKAEHSIRRKLYAEEHTASLTFDDIVGEGTLMGRVKQQAKRFARSEASVLIIGETGTGKELFAQAIHTGSAHANGPFVTVNCAAFPKELLESELFGYEEGAFTGARRGGKIGLFELAHGGTLFLDEIGDMPLDLQIRLLRVLQDKRVMRLGSSKLIPVHVRIVTATNRDIAAMVNSGEFREDIFYRINTLMLRIPPLRERTEDIPALAEALLKKHTAQGVRYFSNEALNCLMQRAWRGNVRELEHVIERAVIMCDDPCLLPKHVNMETAPLSPRQPVGTYQKEETAQESPSPSLHNEEKEKIRKVLERCRWRREEAAGLLGISRATLWRKMRELGL